ncbi:cell surface protein [Caloramator sp. E03]|uniref:fibronectin type III domain-containing protein n=1 Tax=Caloramator sp. E03 TaxID=2576307 RepID=UPI00110FFC85|nr:fibronectin type III domain-containing protein [Caloramator sp. E03]QCX33451.1 cell surface protein [Caloramator sp. E03]
MKRAFISLLILTMFLPFLLVRAESVDNTNKILSKNTKLINSTLNITDEIINNKRGIGIINTQKIKAIREKYKKLSSDLLQLTDTGISDTKKSEVKNKLKKLNAYVNKDSAGSKGLKSSSDDLVYVYINLNKEAKINSLKSYINTIKTFDENNGVIAAWVEIKKLKELSLKEEVSSIKTVLPPKVYSGSLISEGDSIHKADTFRNLTDINGSGIKIGIISDGVDSWTIARDRGDLPENVNILSNSVGGDEGTAMLEIVHDLAPGAELYFHDCGTNVLEFNDAVDSLVDAGCNVICDDIGWLSEPNFEDGIVANHIKSVLANNNIVYISSAGNSAQDHYQGLFKNDGYGFHDFDSNTGITPLPVLIPAYSTIIVTLQWDDQFGLSKNNYDLFLEDMDYNLLDYSINLQNGNDYPLEYVIYSNTSSNDIIAYIDVYKYSGVSKTLELYIYGGYVLDNGTAADSIFGHPAVPDVIAVGAINASSPDKIADYSSQGPVTIIYPSKQLRKKPDVCGIDGVMVTGAGGFYSPFYGTSAAAPHVAAIAALIWSQNPSKKASEIRNMIRSGCVDLGSKGYDYIYGNGLLNAVIAGAPSKPKGLIAYPSDKKIILTWEGNEENDLASYQLEYKKSTSNTWTSIAVPKTETSYTINNLKNDIQYDFRIKAKDSLGNWSLYSDLLTQTPFDNVPPPVPKGFKIISVNDGQVALSWLAAYAQDLSGYELEYKQSDEDTWTNIQLGKVIKYTVSGLVNDKEYDFRIRSRDISGNKSDSSTVITGIPTDKTPPAVPKGLKIDSINYDCSVDLLWTANTESDIGGYEIAYARNGTSLWKTIFVDASSTSQKISGLTGNVQYLFKIRSRDLKGNWSNYSSIVKAYSKDGIAPASPTEFIGIVGDKRVTLTWDKNTEEDLAGYQIEYKKSSSNIWAKVSLTRNVTTYTVLNLINGTEYNFRIKAKDTSNNWSEYSYIDIFVK